MTVPRFNPPDDWMRHMWDWPIWGMGWFMLLSLFVLAAIGVAIYYTVTGGRTAARRRGDALELARRRYARGEITAEEFEEIRKRLGDER